MQFTDNPVYQAMPREEVNKLIQARYEQEIQTPGFGQAVFLSVALFTWATP